MQYTNIFLTKDQRRDKLLKDKLVKLSLAKPADYVPARGKLYWDNTRTAKRKQIK